VCTIQDELYEEIDPAAETLTPLGVNAVIRRAAELAVEVETDERDRIISYLEYHFPNDMRLRIALEQIAVLAHQRTRSQSMEAVVEGNSRRSTPVTER
jgi:hypothetical protein